MRKLLYGASLSFQGLRVFVVNFFCWFLFLSLMGCSTTAIKRKYCESLNVYEKGYADGVKGLPSQFFKSYEQECGDYVEVEPKKIQYNQGWKKAVSSFCTEKSGYELGLKGSQYHKVCPKEIESEFLAGYKKGDRKCLYEEGYSSAIEGKEQAFKQSACQKLEGELSEREYQAGHEGGLKVFCGYKNGYKLGLAGTSYKIICSKQTGFFKGYRAGDRRCLYQAGYDHALKDKSSDYQGSICAKSERKRSEREYKKGRRAGLKVFCGYKNGYKLGLAGTSYKIICSKQTGFFKGYRAGDRKCLYQVGYDHALKGEVFSFEQSACQKLKGNKKSYRAGRVAGVKIFCTYKNGYNYGLKGKIYHNICPKKTEDNFFKGYTLGLQEYKAEKRKEEILQMEKARLRAEERSRQEALAIERERIALERERVAEERRSRQEALELHREKMKTEERARKLKGYRLCYYDSDCPSGRRCQYNYAIRENVCIKN